MDSRDSFSSSSMAVSREGGSVADDEGVLSLTSSLAKEAALLFQSRKYAECVDVLIQLHQKKENDPKVLHNMALANFFRDGCLNYKELIEELFIVKKKSKDLARASGEQLEAGSQPGNKTTSGPKGTNSAGHLSENCASLLYTDEFDSSVAILNTAIVLYHLHDYARAMSILEPLFQNIEPIDEGTALHVCLLLLDLAVARQDAAKFADVISYVEKAFGVAHVNQTDNGSMGLQTSNLVMKSTSITVNASTVDDLNSDASASANASEGSLSRTLSDESAEYETLFSTLDMGGQISSRPTNLPSSNDLSRTSSDQLSSVDLKLKLPLYKVQLLFLTRRLKMAKRELKLAMNISRGRDSSNALLLKSQLELARGNYAKAEKLLKACNQPDIGSSVVYNNNLGCIFYQWGKPNTAGVFFKKALVTCSSIRKEKPKQLETISQDKSVLIMYNSGLQYLACGNPVLAAQCFQKAKLVFYSKPLLWLRFAECCLLALETGLSESFNHLLRGSEFRVTVIGQGKWRQLSVEDGLVRKRHTSFTEREGSSSVGGTVPHNLSLVFARQCLRNALYFVQQFESKSVKSSLPLNPTPEENEPSEVGASLKNSNHKHLGFGDSKGSKDMISSSQANANGDIKEQKSGASVNVAPPSSFSEYEDACRRENLKIKQAILVDLAFVELELGNPLGALSKARFLLEMPDHSKICAFLARVYAAEALCLLNKPQEATELLSVFFSGGNIDLPYGKEDCEQWLVNRPLDPEESYAGSVAARNSAAEVNGTVFYKPEDARGVMYVNLASLSAFQGDFDRASQLAAQALSVIPNSREANLMCIYLDLKHGRVQEARARLRSCNHVSFVHCGSRSKGSS